METSNTASTEDQIQPHETLYVNHLNQKIKLDELKRQLFQMFSQFGKVINVVAKKNVQMRGQAFIIFEKIEGAVKAKENLQGFFWMGYQLNIQFAKVRSDVHTKVDGSFEQRENKTEIRSQQWIPKKLRNTTASGQITGTAVNLEINKVLFVENLPEGSNAQSVEEVFKVFLGFKEVRFIEGRNMSFVEYDTEAQAMEALQNLQRKELAPGCPIHISYAKK